MPHVDGILKHAGTLTTHGLEHCRSIHMKPRAHIGERKERAAIDPRLAMHVDDTCAWASQIGKQGLLEVRIPVQQTVLVTVGSIQAGIAVGVFDPKPRRAILWECTVDDVGNAIRRDEPWCYKRSRSNEDSGMKVGRRLPKIVWYRNQHYRTTETWLLMVTRRNSAPRNATPS